MKKRLGLLLFIYSTLLFATAKPPKLVVQIVVDQLRGDLIDLYHREFSADGFNYLLAHGLDFHNAHYPQANTVTCVGHATLATGAYPSFHGIVANEWHDSRNGATYCVDDLQNPILKTSRTQKEAMGKSPKNLVASTLSDEIVLAQSGRAFAVSLKDRAAITLAGHAGKAFWFDKLNGGFVTSKHYYSAYPQWVIDWNQHYESKSLTWTLSHPLDYYHYAKAPRFINRYPGFEQNFPHQTGPANSKHYYKFLSMTPFADELTADFAIDLLAQEKLGKNKDSTDYLALSFSAVDAVGHQFGPNSLESEDNLLRLDKVLAKLLTAIDKQVGLENTLIILTADHGVSDSPAYLTTHKIRENTSLKIPQLRKLIEESLAKHYHLPASSLEAIITPYIYLNHQLLAEHHLTVKQVSLFLAELLTKQAGIFKVYQIPLANKESDWLSAKVNKMVFPGRSGDLYLVPYPFGALDNKNKQRVSHGTPWRYDSYVPLLFVNPSFKAQRIYKPVNITDVAPTLAALLQIKAPSAAFGKPLQEVLNQFDI
ncbi:MAG: alkaline phosphatase family protein [Tatlockia sp.]|nr:alkaline phosphatase family protein [Tatlockia sp.]